jgi:hypothetical protein
VQTNLPPRRFRPGSGGFHEGRGDCVILLPMVAKTTRLGNRSCPGLSRSGQVVCSPQGLLPSLARRGTALPPCPFLSICHDQQGRLRLIKGQASLLARR